MDEKKLFDRLRKSLRMYGYDVPIEEDEIQNFDKESENIDVPEMPDELKDPEKILDRGLIEEVSFKGAPSGDGKISQNLAMAAREGKNIPKEVEERMTKDRKNAEKNDER